jgi:hypothetical protein
MGNRRKPNKDWHRIPVDVIADPETGGGGVDVVDPALCWTIPLEDLTNAVQALQPGMAVRGERAEPRLRVYAGSFIGFVPAPISAEIRVLTDLGSGVLLGQVVEVNLSTRLVVVELCLEGQ